MTAENVSKGLNLKALVTGSTSGIGKAIALRLARAGAEVIIQGRDVARGGDTVREIVAAGGKARFIAAELDKPNELRRLVREVGELDVLVNNAGKSHFGPTAELDVEQFDSLFAGNVRAPFMLVAAFAPAMASRGKGSIINVGSMAGSIGLAGAAAYGATKAALASMTRSWAAEFSGSGVRINTVSPGPVRGTASNPAVIDALGKTTAMGRSASPEEVAEVVVFLASSDASYITGANIAVDGGRTAI